MQIRRLVASCGLLLITVACGRSEAGRDRLPQGTPVVLISIDTLRSDRLPAYGYAGVETPAIDGLRQDSILFSRAYSHVPLTLPSHASLLTGLLPPEHGVRNNLGYRLQTDGLPWIPEILRQAGYATGAGVSAFVLRGATGLEAGWDLYEDRIRVVTRAALGRLQRPGNETLERLLPWVQSVADRPFLLLFHIYEPHSPYAPPEPFASRYEDRYDGEVAAADAIVGQLLAKLEALDLYDRSLVILFSDHGEGLGEHGQPEHEVLIYREILQVPLLLKLPGGARAGETVDRPVQLIDIAPTILELLGLEVPSTLRGTSLVADHELGDQRDLYAESLYPRLHFGWSELTSVIRGRYHYIQSPDPELYDLLEDPAQTRNVLQQQRRVYGELKAALAAFDAGFEPPAAVDPETRDQLAALGYVGSVGSDASGPLPDPKSRMEVLQPMARAYRAFFNADYAAAVLGFRAILEREPQLVDAWEHLGKALQRLGQDEEALVAFEKALTMSGGAAHIALATAELLLEMGELDRAERHAELAKSGHEMAWDLLAQIALRRDDLTAAESYIGRAMEVRGTRIGPLLLAADLALAQERFEEAIDLTEQAEEEIGTDGDREQMRGLYFIRGRAWASQAELDKAKIAMRQEIEQSPDELGPYTHLAFIFALENDSPSAGDVLRQMVETNATPEAYAAAVETLQAMKDDASATALLRYARQRWPDDPRLRELAN